MLLSNSRTILSVFVGSVFLMTACGGAASNVGPQPAIELKATSEFPFATDEPAEFQADIVVSIGNAVSEYRYFKKGESRRIDHVTNGIVTMTYLLSDKFYTIDHTSKQIASTPRGSKLESDIDVSPYRSPAFASPIRYRFERVSTDGDLVMFRVDTGGDEQMIATVTVDTKTNLMMRQEFRSPGSSFVYEMRNVKLDVADGEFSLPADYRTLLAK